MIQPMREIGMQLVLVMLLKIEEKTIIRESICCILMYP